MDTYRKQREAERKQLNRHRWTSSKKVYDRGLADKKYNARRALVDKRYNAEKRKRPYRSYEFIAHDGEGINSCGSDVPCGQVQYIPGSHGNRTFTNHKPGCQKYALLMNSKGERMIDFGGLSTDACLRWLTDQKLLYPKAIHVFFGESYDANMILKDLPYQSVLMLQRTGRVYYRDYRIAYVSRKYLQISRYNPRERGDKRKRKPLCTITLWDVIGFFQGSFVSTLDKYFKGDDRKELEVDKIVAGKSRRSQFSVEEMKDFIIPYTTLEVKALVALMNKLRADMLEAGIHLSRWDGAGAAAAALLKTSGVKKYYAELPPEVETAAQIGYSGGRIEMLKWGHTEAAFEWDMKVVDRAIVKEQVLTGLVYHYDLIGAYPSAMPWLPVLVNGEWIHGTSDYLPLTPYTIYKVYWDYKYRYDTSGNRVGLDRKNVLYPFFYRQPWHEPRVFYPCMGYSWVWEPELSAALKHQDKMRGKIKFYEKWQFVPNTDYKPFAFVEDLYKKRLEYKAQGKGAQLALKLGINSFYGKMAQTVGYNYENDRKPPYYNLMYAGLITSYTRARMFDAAMQQPESIIAIATDGIWSTKPLDLDVGENLGQWEFEILKAMTSVQAGIYFYEKEDGTKLHRYRGFNQGSITEEAVMKNWQEHIPFLSVDSTRFVTMGTAVASEERFNTHWRVWDNAPRTLEIFPVAQKRQTTTDLPHMHLACEQLLPTEAMTPMYFERKVKGPQTLTEEFLSRKHPLPWEEFGDEDDEYGYAVQHETMDSDI